ncbi:MAG: cyclic nucleotide-binding domain-containing protein [Candidatus Promineifilaceae bacterium]
MDANEENSKWLLPDSKMDKETQFQLVSGLERRHYEAGEEIIKQGEEADSFYVLVFGTVEVVRERPHRPLQPIATLNEGDYFGEIGLLEGVKRTASVRASKDSSAEVLVMDRATFADFVTTSKLTEEEIASVVRERILSLQLAKALPMLSPEQIKRVYPQLEMMTFGPGDVILRQGEPADLFYILVSGRCEVIDHRSDGRDKTVDWREPGEYFGEIGLLQNQPRTATVKAGPDSEVEVMALGRDEFLAMTEDSKATEMTIAQKMIQRMISLAQAQ